MHKSCKHKNGELLEEVKVTHSRTITNGVMEDIGYNKIGNITGYEYTCSDCGKSWRYTAWISIKLKWLKEIHDQLAA